MEWTLLSIWGHKYKLAPPLFWRSLPAPPSLSRVSLTLLIFIGLICWQFRMFGQFRMCWSLFIYNIVWTVLIFLGLICWHFRMCGQFLTCWPFLICWQHVPLFMFDNIVWQYFLNINDLSWPDMLTISDDNVDNVDHSSCDPHNVDLSWPDMLTISDVDNFWCWQFLTDNADNVDHSSCDPHNG